MASWKEGLVFAEPVFEKHPVMGKEVKFFTIPGSTIFKLKKFAKPLAKALNVLSDKGNNDSGFTQTERKAEDGSIEIQRVTAPLSPEVIQKRTDLREQAYEQILNMVFDNEELIAEIIIRSLKNFGGNKAPTPTEFMEEVSAPVITELLAGVVKANRKVLGPFSDTILTRIQEALGKLGTLKPLESEQKTESAEKEAEQQP